MKIRQRLLHLLPAMLTVLLVAACGDSREVEEQSLQSPGEPAGVLTVYSAWPDSLNEPLLAAFKDATGTEIVLETDSASALEQRLKREGAAAKADVLLLNNASDLWSASDQDILRPTYSDELAAAVPAMLRDADDTWFAVASRGRVIMFNTDQVESSELAGYHGLADEKWEDRLCLSSSALEENQALVAELMAHTGEREAEITVRGWVQNTGQPFFASDDDLIKAISTGMCHVGIAGSDSLAQLNSAGKALSVAAHWPAAKHGGVHIDVAGGGATRHAKNPDAARVFLEWLAGNDAQHLIGRGGWIALSAESANGDPIEKTPVHVSQSGYWRADAILLADRARYR